MAQGIILGVTPNNCFFMLLIAICFHQVAGAASQ